MKFTFNPNTANRKDYKLWYLLPNVSIRYYRVKNRKVWIIGFAWLTVYASIKFFK